MLSLDLFFIGLLGLLTTSMNYINVSFNSMLAAKMSDDPRKRQVVPTSTLLYLTLSVQNVHLRT
jgi:hypothetical protein